MENQGVVIGSFVNKCHSLAKKYESVKEVICPVCRSTNRNWILYFAGNVFDIYIYGRFSFRSLINVYNISYSSMEFYSAY